MSKKKSIINIQLLKRILSYTKPYKSIFFIAIVLALLGTILSVVRPMLIQYLLNSISDEASKIKSINLKINLLNTIGFALLGVLLLEGILQFLSIVITNFLGQSIIKDLRIQVYQHILSLKNKYFDNTPIGTLVTRSVSDIESLNDVFSQGFIVIISDIITIIVLVSVMFYTNWLLALVSLSTIPLLMLATNLFKNGVKKTFNDVRNAVSELNTFVNERLSGMRIIQLFNREKIEEEKFMQINNKHKIANIKSIWYYSVFFPVVEILSAISIALLIWISGINANKYQIQLGDITFFIMLIHMVFRPIRMLADRLNTLQMGMVASERVFKVLDTQDIISNDGTLKTDNIKGEIEFKNVWFAYNNEDYVIKNCSFKVEQGQSIAIIGPTGAGKSSLMNILTRFYEINKGDIFLDNVSIKAYEQTELRRAIGIVMQDVFLFSDTIINNITLHNPNFIEQDVINACKKIGIHHLIMELPNGYQYEVKERGVMLSAGQRQLIAFARAYIYNPPILILDEATSSIDTETEQLIQTAVIELTKNRTAIIIAHRLSTISYVNNIIVLDKGEIIEQGSPKDLLNNSHGKYAQMLKSHS